MTVITLTKSPKKEKKYRVTFKSNDSSLSKGVPLSRHVDFGQKGYSDYTIHKDRARMKRYIGRHARMGENWSVVTGKYSAGFWSRWLLWSKPSLKAAISSVSKRLRIPIRTRV